MTWLRSRTRRRSPKASTARTYRFRPFVEPLEDRLAPAVFTVIDTGDTAAGVGLFGDLRYCLTRANATPGLDTIQFAIPGAGAHTIQPRSALPAITDPAVLDATTPPGFAGTPVIELDGSLAGPANGLVLRAGNSTVRGFVINRFTVPQGSSPSLGILSIGPGGNVIQGNYIGTDLAGNAVFGTGSRIGYGIWLANDSNVVGTDGDGVNDAAEGNVISGNYAGILLESYPAGSFAANNVIAGNFIGTDATGMLDLGNTRMGVFFLNAGNGNRIGTNADGVSDAAERNVISGNDEAGIYLDSDGNVVAGNYLGTNAAGTAPLSNGSGVVIQAGSNNTISGNLLSGNRVRGIGIIGVPGPATGNVVAGNLIGTDVTGTIPLGNAFAGVLLNTGATNNTVGGSTAGAGNLISGNGRSGIDIFGSGTSGNVVQGNFIGIDVSGTAALGNLGNGVLLTNGATSNTIGGTATGAGNVIAFNRKGVVVSGSGTTGNAILGNAIFANAGLGIDLGDDGVTLNDAAGHSGPNNYQNFPVLTQVTASGSDRTVFGHIRGTPIPLTGSNSSLMTPTIPPGMARARCISAP
ncbi:MAG TPA: hypothetical protein VEL76_25455 [Gemmataceae bacterium]|nr:hypothetical protein [Gemmataceae bacterium]